MAHRCRCPRHQHAHPRRIFPGEISPRRALRFAPHRGAAREALALFPKGGGARTAQATCAAGDPPRVDVAAQTRRTGGHGGRQRGDRGTHTHTHAHTHAHSRTRTRTLPLSLVSLLTIHLSPSLPCSLVCLGHPCAVPHAGAAGVASGGARAHARIRAHRAQTHCRSYGIIRFEFEIGSSE